MQTRAAWETSLKAVLRPAGQSDFRVAASYDLTKALFNADAYDIRVIRNMLFGEADVPERVEGRVVDQDGQQLAFEAPKPPFEQTFRWAPT